MPYYLDNAFLLDNPWITVVGCGGTGGFVAEGLCRLFQGRKAEAPRISSPFSALPGLSSATRRTQA